MSLIKESRAHLSAKHERLEYIDSLRGIAIIAVIITHIGSLVQLSGLTRKITELGGMGVQLFFVISAFTIFFTLSRNENSPNLIRDFFIKRLFRIIPVYWFGIILYTVVYGVMESRGWREGPELWHYPVHFLLLNVLHPMTSSSVVPGGWSISAEVLFYMTVPILFTFINTRRRLLAFLVFTVCMLPIINIALSRVGPYVFPDVDTRTLRTFWYRWLPNQLACFAFGMLMFYIYKNKRLVSFLSDKVVSLLLTFALCIFFVSFVFLSSLIPQKHHLYAFLFMVFGLVLSVTPWKLVVNDLTVFIGRISFSCYLIHFLVLEKTATFLKLYFPVLMESKMLYFSTMVVLGFALTIPLSYLSYKLLELPAVKAGKQVITYLDKRGNVTETHKDNAKVLVNK